MSKDKLNIGILTDVSFRKFAPTKKNKRMVSMYANVSQSDSSMHSGHTDLIESSWVDGIRKLETKARDLRDTYTVPWFGETEDDGGKPKFVKRDGMRLLPAGCITSYQDKLASLKKKWESAVDEFVNRWGEIIEDSRERLNGDFDPTKYPSAQHIRSRFQMRAEFMPMPDNGRLPSYLQDGMDDVYDERVKAAGTELRIRLIDKLKHLRDKCANVGGESSGKFYTSNVTNVLELCELLPDMLIGDDPELVKAIEDAKRMLDGLDADAIKSSEIIAQDVRSKASAIASSLLI